MEDIKTKETTAPEAMSAAGVQPIGAEQLKRFTQVLEKYKAGKAHGTLMKARGQRMAAAAEQH